ncbi:MAG: hypothetical protein QM214_01080 [Bacillota bacterium]|jgi:hypothetical protein|nr:hypothetical protein [Bacillota bacterium]HHU43942.1 hypothetical protein [Clostridiales bacterium]
MSKDQSQKPQKNTDIKDADSKNKEVNEAVEKTAKTSASEISPPKEIRAKVPPIIENKEKAPKEDKEKAAQESKEKAPEESKEKITSEQKPNKAEEISPSKDSKTKPKAEERSETEEPKLNAEESSETEEPKLNAEESSEAQEPKVKDGKEPMDSQEKGGKEPMDSQEKEQAPQAQEDTLKDEESAPKEEQEKSLALTPEEKEELERKEREKKLKEQEKKRRALERKQKFFAFIKKNKLWVILAAVVLVLAIGVATTILVINAPKVFIREPLDFTEKNLSGKELYVLREDITIQNLTIPRRMDIDLNHRSLTVTDTLTIELGSAKDKSIDIGTIQGLFKHKGFGKGGKLIANNIKITANGRTINLYSQSELSGEIAVKELNVFEKMNIKDKLELKNSQIKIYADTSGTVELVNSSLYLAEGISLERAVADGFSNAELYGNVTASIEGGNKIKVLKNASCALVSDAKELYFQQQTAEILNVIDIENLYIVNQLEKPSKLLVETTGSSFICVVSEVINADKYIFTIFADDKKIAEIDSPTNRLDISPYLTRPTVYTISVKAASSNPEINLTSEEISIEYSYSAKLENPSLSIDTQDGEVMLTFPKVTFATAYKININDIEITKESEEALISVNITEHVMSPGSYAIRVTALNPNNKSFMPSDTVMISYLRTPKLETPNLEIEKTQKGIKLSWQQVPGAKYYVIQSSKDDKLIMTKDTSYTLTDVEDNTTFYVYALETGYYLRSDSSAVIYVYEALDKPEALDFSIEDELLTITSQPVPHAEEYALYQNGVQVQTNSSPIFEVQEFEEGDEFKIQARAQGYRPSESDIKTYSA